MKEHAIRVLKGLLKQLNSEVESFNDEWNDLTARELKFKKDLKNLTDGLSIEFNFK